MNDQNDPDNSSAIGSPDTPAFGRREELPISLSQQLQQKIAAGGERYTARSPQEMLQPRVVPPPAKRSNQARSGIIVSLNSCMS